VCSGCVESADYSCWDWKNSSYNTRILKKNGNPSTVLHTPTTSSRGIIIIIKTPRDHRIGFNLYDDDDDDDGVISIQFG
jgi:hypothetical protein